MKIGVPSRRASSRSFVGSVSSEWNEMLTMTGAVRAKRKRFVELRGKGFTDEQLRAVGAALTTASRRQRKLAVHAAVCSAVMQAYWAGRDRERREADCLKAIRNDGGQLGPLNYYESIIRKHDPVAAAKLLAEHHAERITAIRYIVAATINEARREDAIAKGVDPTTVKYLAVRTK
jgi:hypothetical protein